MDVYLLNFVKNRRSTAQPNLTGRTPISGKLKTPSTILAPVVEFCYSPSTMGAFASYNYAFIIEFSRYYYITTVELDGNLARVHMAVDPLASWKSAIDASSQYVLRSGSSYNGNIKDGRYPMLAKDPAVSVSKIDNPVEPTATDYGVFIVGIVSPDISLSGGVTYWAMSYLVLYTFMQKMFTLSTQWGNEGQDLADALKESITDPFQYITSIMWLPYSTQDFVNRGMVQTGTSSVKVAYWTVNVTGSAYPFSATVLHTEFTNMISLTVPKHPQAASRGAYLNFAPYSRYCLSFYPFFSLVDVDPTRIGGKTTLYCVYSVDLRTGKAVASICTEYYGTTYTDWKPKNPIRVVEAQVGVNIPLTTIRTEMTFNPLTYMQNLAAAISSEFGGFNQVIPKTLEKWKLKTNIALSPNTDNPVVAENVAAWQQQLNEIPDTNDVLDAAAAMPSTCETIGSQGTMSLNYRMPVMLFGIFYEIASQGDTRFGRPLCTETSLSGLSGFCQCANPTISFSGMTLSEQEDIETMMASGIYLAV